MKKIDGHAHIVDTIAGFNGKGRLALMPLGTVMLFGMMVI